MKLSRFTTTLVFPKDNPDAATRIALGYRLAGALAFNQRMASMRIEEGSDSKDFYLPLTISPPTQEDQIEVVCEGALKKAKSAIANKDGQLCVLLTVSDKDLESSLSTGFIKIRTRDGSRTDEINCFLDRVPPLKITPNVLRFRWNDSIQRWESEAMVQVATERANPTKTGDKQDIRIRASLGKKKIETEVKQIRNGLARAYIRIPDRETFDEKVNLEWDVRLRSKMFESVTRAVSLTPK